MQKYNTKNSWVKILITVHRLSTTNRHPIKLIFSSSFSEKQPLQNVFCKPTFNKIDSLRHLLRPKMLNLVILTVEHEVNREVLMTNCLINNSLVRLHIAETLKNRCNYPEEYYHTKWNRSHFTWKSTLTSLLWLPNTLTIRHTLHWLKTFKICIQLIKKLVWW